MGITEKGKKGFQSMPTEEQRNKRISVYLTEEEHLKLKKYCSTQKETQSNIIRDFILKII
jgi:hypothetical protein|tara:strand:- start:59 stop:238 length:180 start_codon:yes stop_codon:yes gene_type:complete